MCSLQQKLRSVVVLLVIILAWFYFHYRLKQGGPVLQAQPSQELVDQRQASRKSAILETCKRHPWLKSFPDNLHRDSLNLYYDQRNGFIFCEISKAGSMTWQSHLTDLAGRTEWVDRYKRLDLPDHTGNNSFRKFLHRNKYLLPAKLTPEAAFRKFYSFLFVRNPFNKLVSAFDQKLARPKAQVMMSLKNVWQSIVDNFRMNNTGTNANSASEKPTNQNAGTANAANQAPPRPSEFVDYLLAVHKRNEVVSLESHLRPQWVACPVCKVNFSHVGKVETFDEDVDHVTKKLRIQHLLKSPHLHANDHAKANRSLSGDRFKIFFSQVDRDKIRRLYEMYRIDFELFGYERPDFEQMGV